MSTTKFITDEIIAQKQALRVEMRRRRAALSETERTEASRSLCNTLLRFLEMRRERTIGVYLATPTEISLDPMFSTLLSDGYTVAAPRTDATSGEMSFWQLEDLNEVEIGPWRLRQPSMKRRVEHIPLILVPGLAFDLEGGRLGMGRGYYDRFLSVSCISVGVCFDCQVVSAVPTEAHDKGVDFVVSELQCFDVLKSTLNRRLNGAFNMRQGT